MVPFISDPLIHETFAEYLNMNTFEYNIHLNIYLLNVTL